jgi:hypothetical protein
MDILHQQLNIRQTIGDNYIQYNTYNTLPTYFLLNFTYKINQFKGNRKSEDNRPRFDRFGPDGGDRPPGAPGNRGDRGDRGDRGGF